MSAIISKALRDEVVQLVKQREKSVFGNFEKMYITRARQIARYQKISLTSEHIKRLKAKAREEFDASM